MPPRIYQANKSVTPQPSRAVLALQKQQPRQIPLDAKLYSIQEASTLLNEQFDGGFSVRVMRRLIQTGVWEQGWHYTKRGSRIKIYLSAVQEWHLRGEEA